MNTPLVVGIDMGYGHLRAAAPLAERLGTGVLQCDRPPLADGDEQRLWAEARRLYEVASRVSQLPGIGRPLQAALDALTFIPHLHPYRDLSSPTAGVRVLDRFARRGLGAGLSRTLAESDRALLTTFFAPAITANHDGCERIHCVVTDSDINRAWAPLDAGRSRIQYFAPSTRVVRRLRAYGVAHEKILYTGFPLPHALLGGPQLGALKRNLAARLVRLDPDHAFRDQFQEALDYFFGPLPTSEERAPPRITFAVGGAGAQQGMAREFLPRLRDPLRAGRFTLTLVAGVRGEVADGFHRALDDAGLGAEVGRSVEVLHETDVFAYFTRFNRRLADTDVLWTKPSEMTFYAALGIPLLFCAPIGVHEQYNRRWAMECGAGLKQRDTRFAAEWLADWLADGTLAGAAWSGFMRLPKRGLYRILEAVGFPVAEGSDDRAGGGAGQAGAVEHAQAVAAPLDGAVKQPV